jgi:prepilin-type N-terminal cleavage/methylation domain-containing protein
VCVSSAADESGFSLIEVIVAMLIFALASVAASGMFLTGLKTSLVAKLDTGAKNLAQEVMEKARNLPYHVDSSVSAPDLLGTYFPSLTPLAGATSGTVAPPGYVPATAGAAYRLSSEPATGGFYRTVISPVPQFPKYSQYIAVQYLDANNAAVTPAAAYSTDAFPSTMVGMTVTTKWVAGSITKLLRTYTQIADGQPSNALVTASANAMALKVVTSLDSWTSGGALNARQMTLTAGQLDLKGSTTKASAASGTGVAGDVFISSPSDTPGATATAAAPPDQPVQSAAVNQQTVNDGVLGIPVASFGQTSVAGLSATTTNSLPNVGSSTTPASTTMGAAGSGSYGLTVNNSATYLPRLRLMPGAPLVFTGNTTVMTTNGYVQTTPAVAGHSVSAATTATLTTLHLLPTTFAPQGLLLITLSSASLTCTSTGGVATATPAYNATVMWFDPTAAGSYMTKSVVAGNATDPLTSVANLLWCPAAGGAPPAGADRVNSTAGVDLYLGDYFAAGSLQSLIQPTALAARQFDNGGSGVTDTLPPIVTVATQPLAVGQDGLSPDSGSSVGVQVGALACSAGDYR